MPITGQGWELLLVRETEQVNPADPAELRTVGRYQLFHDGLAQSGALLSGAFAEAKGPGDNSTPGNGRRIEPGRYALQSWGGERYVTHGYSTAEDDPEVLPLPGFELRGCLPRTEILIHPGAGFLRSVGCINPCGALPDASASIGYADSRRRVIALLDDLRAYLGAAFPTENDLPVPRAFVIIDGEPGGVGSAS